MHNVPSVSIAILALATIAWHPAWAQTSAVVVLPGFKSPVQMDTIGTPRTMDRDAAAVFSAAATAFDRLKIEPDVRDSASLVVGKLKLQVVRTYLGAPLSRAVDCGVGSGMRGARADFDRVHLAILAIIKPLNATSSELRLAVAAGSQALGGTLADQISCISTGGIEEKLQRAIDAELAKSAH